MTFRLTLGTVLAFLTWLSMHLAIWRVGLLFELVPVTMSVTAIWLCRRAEDQRVWKTLALAVLLSALAAGPILAFESRFTDPPSRLDDSPIGLLRSHQLMTCLIAGGVYGAVLSCATCLCWELQIAP